MQRERLHAQPRHAQLQRRGQEQRRPGTCEPHRGPHPRNDSQPPDAVHNLTATQEAGTRNVTVQWEPAETGTAGDTYTVAGVPGRTRTRSIQDCASSGGRTTCNVTFPDLDTGTYTFTVTPSSLGTPGAASTTTLTVVETEAPAAVENLEGRQDGDANAAIITRNAPASGGPAARYIVTRESHDVRTIETGECHRSGSSCSTRFDSLTHDTHHFEVAAENTGGRGPAQTVAVAIDRAAPPLTASFSDIPEAHNGTAFRFKLTFSENVPITYRRLRNAAFSVQGGRTTRAQRVVRGQGDNTNWWITIRPLASDQEVVITLEGERACATTGAVCTDDGRMLSNTPTATVGP